MQEDPKAVWNGFGKECGNPDGRGHRNLVIELMKIKQLLLQAPHWQHAQSQHSYQTQHSVFGGISKPIHGEPSYHTL